MAPNGHATLTHAEPDLTTREELADEAARRARLAFYATDPAIAHGHREAANALIWALTLLPTPGTHPEG